MLNIFTHHVIISLQYIKEGVLRMLMLYTNIKKRRLELKMSQDTLAELTGYKDRSSIAKIEKGDVDLAESKIREFAKALKTTPQDLMGWEESSSQELNPGVNIVDKKGNVTTFDVSTVIYAITKSLTNLPLERQEMVLDVVEGQNKRKKVIYVENPKNRQKPTKEISPHLLPNAAHACTDKSITDADRKHDEDIMDDENF